VQDVAAGARAATATSVGLTLLPAHLGSPGGAAGGLQAVLVGKAACRLGLIGLCSRRCCKQTYPSSCLSYLGLVACSLLVL
jgi:hypothetical protein